MIADLTQRGFCDSSDVSQLVLACYCAAAHDAQLRLVVPHPNVLGALKLTVLDRLLPVYPSLEAALSAGPGPGAVAGRG